jgi:hypothetical protein
MEMYGGDSRSLPFRVVRHEDYASASLLKGPRNVRTEKHIFNTVPLILLRAIDKHRQRTWGKILDRGWAVHVGHWWHGWCWTWDGPLDYSFDSSGS